MPLGAKKRTLMSLPESRWVLFGLKSKIVAQVLVLRHEAKAGLVQRSLRVESLSNNLQCFQFPLGVTYL